MANNEIDSLSFSISVKGLSPKTIEKIQAFSKALQDLNNVVKNIDLSQLDYLQNVNSFVGLNLKSMASGLDKVNNVLKRADFSKLAQLKAPINIFQVPKSNTGEIQKQAESTDDLSNAIHNLSNALDIVKKKSGGKGINLGLNENVKKEIAENKQLQAMLKQAGVLTTEDGKKSASYYEKSNKIVKTLRRIKLIAFIKLIRGALNAVIKGFQTGIQQLAVYSKDFNGTMSQMTTNFQKINAGLSLVAQPLLEALLPVVQSFTDVLVDLGNALSKANAQAKGLSTYTKVSSKYAKDYAKSMQQGTLFSFDTFNTLNAQENPFETAKIDEEDNEEASELMQTINSIKEIGVVIADLVKTIAPYISKILKFINPILKTIIDISNRATNTLKPSIENILQLIIKIVELLAPIINDILTALEPILQAINQDLIPPLISLLETIIKPIADIIKQLPIKEIVTLIVNVLAPVIKLIGKIITFIVSILKPVLDFLEPVLNQALKVINKIVEILSPIINSIGALLDNLFDGNAWKRLFQGIVKMLASILDWFINKCIEAINIIIANDVVKSIVGFFGGDWQGITWRSNLAGLVPNITDDEDTGFFGKKSPFVSDNRLSQSYGASQEQMALAFEQAIYNTGLLDYIENAGNISIDGKEIAQSNNFKRELNRTNPKLALK